MPRGGDATEAVPLPALCNAQGALEFHVVAAILSSWRSVERRVAAFGAISLLNQCLPAMGA
jgi:hypothetical protein